jgi:hypothetical protein
VPTSPTALNHSAADIMRYLLISLGQGTLPQAGQAWPIGAYVEPAEPDNLVTLFDTEAGAQDDRVMSGEMAARYSYQVRVRAKDDRTTWVKANNIREALAAFYGRNVTISGESYEVQCAVKIGNVIPLGKETPTSMRSICTLNAMAVIRRIS